VSAIAVTSLRPLAGFRIVSLAVNIPGPVAAARLRDLGAAVLKIEPPAGDPLALFSIAWYTELCRDMAVRTLDLKSESGMAELSGHLESADLLLTANRPAALTRLGLDWPRLQAINGGMCHVGILGHTPPNEDLPGHDLTYQAALGTVEPPRLPRVLLADMAGAQEATSTAMALLLARERGRGAGQAWVSLEHAAQTFTVAFREGLTAPGGVLGDGIPNYNIYPTADGHIALAALEPHFLRRLLDAIGQEAVDQDTLRGLFATDTSDTWVGWARAHQIPLAKIEG